MDERGLIDVDVASLPEEFEIELSGDNVYLRFDFNEEGQFYTVDLFNNAYEPIVTGERLVYGQRLWRDFTKPEIPQVDIVPFDISHKENTVTSDNFGRTVFLYLMTFEDDEVM